MKFSKLRRRLIAFVGKKNNVSLLQQSPFFDQDWYTSRNTDIGEVDALVHYLYHGGFEGRAAGPLFDSRRYLDAYPDVLRADVNPLVHYLRSGQKEGRTPFHVEPHLAPALAEVQNRDLDLLSASKLFDPVWYVQTHPELRGLDPYRHFLAIGGAQGLMASPNFDCEAYSTAYPDVRAAKMNPLIHYLRYGIHEGRSSSPSATAETHLASASVEAQNQDLDLLIASELFDPVWYVRTYPELQGLDPYHHCLSIGDMEGVMASPNFDCEAYSAAYPDVRAAKMNPLIHYLRYGMREGRSPGLSAAERSTVKQTVDDVKGLDPEIEATHQLFPPHHIKCSINRSMPIGRVPAAWRELFRDLPGQIDHMVFAPWLVRGGADLACVNIVRAAQEARGVHKVLLVITDHDRLEAFGWLPAGTQVLVLSDYDSTLNNDERKQIVESLIFALRPDSIMNVNSLACWTAIADKGRALKTMTRLYATLFCRDLTPDGRGAGYSDTHFRAGLHHLEKIYFDTRSFILEMAERYGLDENLQEKLQFLPQPILDQLHAATAAEKKNKTSRRVLWAGRFCHQKNTELLERIVKRMPDVYFDVWGAGEAARQESLERLAEVAPNLRLCGSFTSFADLPLSTYSAYLFTSRFEGMPTVLINAAAAGLPIIASSVGGVPELVTHKTGWLVEALDDETAYCEALSEVFDSPLEVDQRLAAMREKVRIERSWESFTGLLRSESDFLQHRSVA